jgi:FtsP/CotA-like multicopper oxidase with cupredoxin domain
MGVLRNFLLSHSLCQTTHTKLEMLFVSFPGQNNCLDYTWNITNDHPGGTYWYHSHHHGSTEEQVTGGAYGLLIVEDNPILDPTLPSWTKNELLLQIAINWNTLLGNGKEGDEILDVEAGQWYRLRVSVVSAVAVPRFLIFEEDITTTDGNCDIYKVASDGIWRSEVPGPLPTNYSFALTGASRADFAIRCLIPNTMVNVTYGKYLAATLQVGGIAVKPVTMSTSWIPNRPASLQNLTFATVPDLNRNVSFHMSYDSINDMSWDPSTPLATIGYDEVHEWTLVGTSGHPFHLHLYHMQVVTPGGCGPNHEEGEWYDTIASGIPGQDCVVRFKTADIGQRCVLHCHVLFHEDNGSMGWVDVQGPGMPTNDVVSLQYSCPVVPTASPSLAPNDIPPSQTPASSPPTTSSNGGSPIGNEIGTSTAAPGGDIAGVNTTPASGACATPTTIKTKLGLFFFAVGSMLSWTLPCME